MYYDYKRLVTDLKNLQKYGFAEISCAGKSIEGKDIPCVRLGRGKTKIMLGAAYHGLEYLTAAVLMRFLDDFAGHVVSGEAFFGRDPLCLYNKVEIVALPMVNADGVDIAVHGLDITNPVHRRLISLVGIHSFRSVWQANARGVDLNHNYDAQWSAVVDRPAPSKHGGTEPESEPETKAVADLMRRENFDMVLALHSQGGEIYYDFDGAAGAKSLETAQKMAKESGYAVCVPQGTAAFGGCKDWFIKEFGKDGFTIEIGHGKNPLPLSMLDEVYVQSARIILCALEA